MNEPKYKHGDRVRHAGRPEWGVGTVEHAAAITHEGRAAHRLTITFQHAGRKTINTGFAQIVDADAPLSTHRPAANSANDGDETGVHDEPTDATPTIEQMAELPESTRDKLSTSKQRLIATLEQFRFDDTPRAMIDWAIAQSGMVDPMAHYGREELDRAFRQFIRARRKHLRDLAYFMQRDGEVEALREVIAKLDDRRKAALREALKR